jgi:fumarate hydratase class II
MNQEDRMSFRVEKDSMGEVRVPENALYAAQTQRAVDNFPISASRFRVPFVRALVPYQSRRSAR